MFDRVLNTSHSIRLSLVNPYQVKLMFSVLFVMGLFWLVICFDHLLDYFCDNLFFNFCEMGIVFLIPAFEQICFTKHNGTIIELTFIMFVVQDRLHEERKWRSYLYLLCMFVDCKCYCSNFFCSSICVINGSLSILKLKIGKSLKFARKSSWKFLIPSW